MQARDWQIIGQGTSLFLCWLKRLVEILSLEVSLNVPLHCVQETEDTTVPEVFCAAEAEKCGLLYIRAVVIGNVVFSQYNALRSPVRSSWPNSLHSIAFQYSQIPYAPHTFFSRMGNAFSAASSIFICSELWNSARWSVF